MTGLLWHLSPIGPSELHRRFLADEPGEAMVELLCGRRLHRRAVEEIWRLWSALPPGKRTKLRDLCWHGGITARLLAEVAKRRGPKRTVALNRLLSLADQRTLAPLLSMWSRLTPGERENVLSFISRFDSPGLAALFWRMVALPAPDPPGEMARLIRCAGPNMLKAVSATLKSGQPSAWAWDALVRLGTREAEESLIGCLGRQDILGERAKTRYMTLPADRSLPLLMETARFHPSWEVRVGAVTVLLGRKEPQALRFLTELLRDRSWYEDFPCGTPPEGYHSWPALFGLKA
ncbi:MAG: HEAT repeat domain-containing protein [Bacteroidota bacterium]